MYVCIYMYIYIYTCVYNLFSQTSLTLNSDKMPRHLCGPHLHTQIPTYLVTNLNK